MVSVTRGRIVAAAFSVIAIAGGVALARGANSTAYRLVPGYDLPTKIDEVGASLNSFPSGLITSQYIDANTAVANAAKAAGHLATSTNPLSVQLVLYTSGHANVDADGVEQPAVHDRPAWIVRFTGTPQPIYGPMGQDGQAVDPGVVATELNVVIDAASGAVIEMFSYR